MIIPVMALDMNNKQLSQRQYEELVERLLTFSIEDLKAAVTSMRGREQ